MTEGMQNAMSPMPQMTVPAMTKVSSADMLGEEARAE